MSKPEPPSDLWEKIDNAIADLQKPKPIPDGCFTTGEFARKYGLTEAGARHRIFKLIAEGKVELAGKHSYPTGGKAFLYRIKK